MRIATCLMCALILLVPGPVIAAKVTTVALSSQDGHTLARIDVDGTVRFTHQTEIAKDGRPFRVFVDVLSARHQLPAREFSVLPHCPIQRIRTSQYSVTPEEIVRIVFDMEAETVYRVTSDDKSITLSFLDGQGRQFAAWSTATFSAPARPEPARPGQQPGAVASTTPVSAAPKSAKETNKAINEDRLLSLAPETESHDHQSTKPPTGSVAVAGQEQSISQAPVPEQDVKPPATKQPAVLTVNVPYGPVLDPALLASPTSGNSQQEVASSKATPAPKKPSESAARTSSTFAQKGAEEPAEPVKATTPRTNNKSEPSSDTVTGTPEARDTAAPDTDKGVRDNQDSDSKPPTSRFRRSPTRPSKIKGTLVAEFPKRLVIKYKERSSRDPFETLINETKKYNDPIEGRIPNVEVLKLVGVAESEGGFHSALFEDKDGYGYILREGDKVENGYVLRVELDRVYFQIFEYGWSRTVALNIDID